MNLGEGVVLAIGTYLLGKNQLSIGNMYLILSYVGILNIPFYNLKFEFTQLPIVSAAMERINLIYKLKKFEKVDGIKKKLESGSIVFENVSFGYETNNIVLKDVSFSIDSGERVLISGRTGSGKSTILMLIAGLYKEDVGNITVGGYAIKEYVREAYLESIYYIFQSNPVINDSVKNNLTRYNNKLDKEEIMRVIMAAKLEDWMSKGDKKLETIISSEDVTQDEEQLIAWAAAVLAKPKILLVDEFDASIHDDTIKIIVELIENYFANTTIIFVSHKCRSTIKMQKKIFIDVGVANIVE